MRYALLILIALPFLACDDDEPAPDAAVVAPDATTPAPDATAQPQPDAAPAADVGPTPDAAEPDAALGDTVDARQYCEQAVDVFCPYYVRCGRMAVADEAECRSVFVESCNAKYEPIYAAHADRDELVLSRAGIEACRAHLEAVDCGAQNFDLDGPCGEMWLGQVAAGGTCAPGIGSFICGEGTDCRISVETFCGECSAVVGVGEPCGEAADGARCASSAECRQDVCVVRPTAGQACAEDGPRCATGTRCTDGVCAIRPWAGPGEACGQAARCRYRSDCIDGACVVGALLGEACGAGQPCATGWCDGGTCAAPKIGGVACAASGECVSGACVDGLCLEPRGPCFAQ